MNVCVQCKECRLIISVSCHFDVSHMSYLWRIVRVNHGKQQTLLVIANCESSISAESYLRVYRYVGQCGVDNKSILPCL